MIVKERMNLCWSCDHAEDLSGELQLDIHACTCEISDHFGHVLTSQHPMCPKFKT